MTFIHAGGVGKTTTARDLGAELSRRGHRVLLIDFDPQANLTNWLGVIDAPESSTLLGSLRDYHTPPAPLPVAGYPRLELVPSHLDLAMVEGTLAGATNGDIRLREAVNIYREQGYDYIIIDAPPSLGKLTENAAKAADWVVVPLEPTLKGVSALTGVQQMLREYARGNPRLRPVMFLVTKMKNTRDAREVAGDYVQVLGDHLAGHTTDRPAVYSGCQNRGQPLDERDPEAYREVVALTDALLVRLGAGGVR